MYEKIAPSDEGAAPYRRDGRLIVTTAVSVLLAVLLLVPLGYFMSMMYRYHGYTQDLAVSFVYGERNGTVTLRTEDGERAVDRVRAEMLFSRIMNAGMGHPRRELPQTDGLALSFGEGSELWIWPAAITERGRDRDTGVRLHYIRPDGSSFSYDTDELQYEDILRALG